MYLSTCPREQKKKTEANKRLEYEERESLIRTLTSPCHDSIWYVVRRGNLAMCTDTPLARKGTQVCSCSSSPFSTSSTSFGSLNIVVSSTSLSFLLVHCKLYRIS